MTDPARTPLRNPPGGKIRSSVGKARRALPMTGDSPVGRAPTCSQPTERSSWWLVALGAALVAAASCTSHGAGPQPVRLKSAGCIEQRGTLQAEPLPMMCGFTAARSF